MIDNVILKIRDRESDQSIWGWDFIKVVKISEGRTIEWIPTTKRDDPDHKYFWDRLPNGDIKKIVTHEKEIIAHAYDLDEDGFITQSDLITISDEEFWDMLCYEYNLFKLE